MEDNFKILNCDQGDIVIDFNGCIVKVSQLDLALSKVILDNGSLNRLNEQLKSINSRNLPSIKDSSNWFNQGVECQILQPSKNWESGKLRMKVIIEFSPDEPESPLDDLRRMINETIS